MERFVWCVLGVAVVGGCDDFEGKPIPDTALDAVPAARSNQTRIAITFHAEGEANGFVCQLDELDPVECAPPFEADVGEGPHRFRVAAALGARVDLSPAEHAWTVDATPPDTAIAMAPPALDNSLTPTFAFTGSDGAGDAAVTFECALDGDPFAPCASPAELVVVDGQHVFAVRAVDAAGNLDSSPAEHAWIIDATAPETIVFEGPASNSTTGRATAFAFRSPDTAATFECSLDGAAYAACSSPRTLADLAGGAHTFAVRARDASAVDPSPVMRAWTVDATPPAVTVTAAPASPSNDELPAFAFTSDDSAATYACQIDDVVAFTACTSPWTAPSAVPAGARTFRVRATDPYGNVSALATHAWTIDRTPPDTEIAAAPPSPTHDATADFTFAATPTEPATFECAIDGMPFVACSSPFATEALADGSHTLDVRAVDAAGNADPSPATHAWIVDTIAPATAFASTEPDPTNDATGDFTFTATEACTFECALDDGAFVTCATPYSTPALADGPHTLQVRARDAAGHTDASPASHTWTVDTAAPIVAITDAPPARWPVTYYDFAFAANEPATFTCALDGAAPAPCAASDGRVTGFGDGATATYVVRATDAAGNVGVTSAMWTTERGLVLHYPFEQGSLANTSLLAQRPAYSVDGTAVASVVGGWAGTALAPSATHALPANVGPLTSSPDGSYTITFWLRRVAGGGDGTILSTLQDDAGIHVAAVAATNSLQVTFGSTLATVALPAGTWTHVAIVTEPGAGTIFVDGVEQAMAVVPADPFTAQQGPLRFGAVDAALDDVRFYNRALAAAELETFAPGIELDFEGAIVDTGNGGTTAISRIGNPAFTAGSLGRALVVSSGFALEVAGIHDYVARVSGGRTLTFSFDASAGAGLLVDTLTECVSGVCGVSIAFDGSELVVEAATSTGTGSLAYALPALDGFTTVALVQHRSAAGATEGLSLFVGGVKVGTVDVGSADVLAEGSDAIRLPFEAGVVFDELELWPLDLTRDGATLCANGFDGEHDPATGACTLTAN